MSRSNTKTRNAIVRSQVKTWIAIITIYPVGTGNVIVYYARESYAQTAKSAREGETIYFSNMTEQTAVKSKKKTIFYNRQLQFLLQIESANNR